MKNYASLPVWSSACGINWYIFVHSEHEGIKPNIMRILNIWEERKIYDKKFVKELKAILENGMYLNFNAIGRAPDS